MRTKLLMLLLLISSLAYSQIPTSGLVADYQFINGNLGDGANGINFVKTGTASTNTSDYLGAANNALNLNGDHMTRPDYSFTNHEMSVSFWIKTDTDDHGIRTIIDQSNRTTEDFTGNESGMYFFIRDGLIGVRSKVFMKPYAQNPVVSHVRAVYATTNIADNQWHHVVITMNRRFNNSNSSSPFYWYYVDYEIYIDNIIELTYSEQHKTKVLISEYHNSGDFVIAQNRSTTIPDSLRFMDQIDNILFYDRKIPDTDVAAIGLNNGYCFTPSSSTITPSNLTETSIDIAWPDAGNYDLAYVLKDQPLANATVMSNLNHAANEAHTISGLLQSTHYDYYIRKHCTSVPSTWTSVLGFRTRGRIYVNHAATGANNGSSWADAFTNLNEAVSVSLGGQEMWVAQGSYIPHPTDRLKRFVFNKTDMEMFGGFVGTETMLSQRDFRLNKTILSGDLLGNDDNIIAFNNATRTDNSNIVLEVRNTTILDGLTITGGEAIAQNQQGAGIFMGDRSATLRLKNCTISKNIALKNGAGLYISNFGRKTNVEIENCIFSENLARNGSSYYHDHKAYKGINIKIEGTLFSNNTATNNGSDLGSAGSGGYFFAHGTQFNSTFNIQFSNNTYANNEDTGTASGLNNYKRATIALLKGESNNGVTATISNCIFWNNTTLGGGATKAVGPLTYTLGVATASNSVDQDNFSLLSSGDKTNIINSDPLFVDAANNDFSLPPTSPAANFGDNSYVGSTYTYDLNGDPRINSGVVDAGAYEYQCPTCIAILTTIIGNGAVTQTSAIYATGDAATVTAVPSTNWEFDHWSGDVSGTINPLQLTVTADVHLTAHFRVAPTYVDINATGLNDGSSWTNAYTDLQTAIDNTVDTLQIWVAQGTYTPTGNGRKSTYTINKSIEIYGGFQGNELSFIQRDPSQYPTILSGDLNSDDNATITDIEPTRQDNAYHILRLKGNFLVRGVVDGFTISGGNANGSIDHSCANPKVDNFNDKIGGAIYVNPDNTNRKVFMKFKNCIIEKNTGERHGVMATYSPCAALGTRSTIDFESCIIRDNYSDLYENMAYTASITYNNKRYGKIMNCLFYNNVSNSRSAVLLISGGTPSGSAAKIDIINSTFTNNTGVNNKVILASNANKGVWSNSIIWNNGSTSPIDLATSSPPAALNCIIEGGGLSAMNSDPLFVDPTTYNYTLVGLEMLQELPIL